MVAFGPSIENGTTRNQWIQEILLTTRPYGATPIAGMMDDARRFIWHDDTPDPLNSGQFFGPSKDPARDCDLPPELRHSPHRPASEYGSAALVRERVERAARALTIEQKTSANDLATSTVNPTRFATFVGRLRSEHGQSVSAQARPSTARPLDLSPLHVPRL